MPAAHKITPFGVRMPPDLKNQIAELANKNRRSMNAEILCLIERALADGLRQKENPTAQ